MLPRGRIRYSTDRCSPVFAPCSWAAGFTVTRGTTAAALADGRATAKERKSIDAVIKACPPTGDGQHATFARLWTFQREFDRKVVSSGNARPKAETRASLRRQFRSRGGLTITVRRDDAPHNAVVHGRSLIDQKEQNTLPRERASVSATGGRCLPLRRKLNTQ